MRTFLPQKHLILFLLVLWAGRSFATPACPIITQSFANTPNGATVDNSSTGWYIDASKLVNPSPVTFAVKSNRFTAENIGHEGIWYSRVFSLSGYTNFYAAVKITAEGLQDSTEYVKIYYKINGGAETLLGQNTGNFGTFDFTSGLLTGSTVQLVVHIYDYAHASQTSKYYIEQYRIYKDPAPCIIGAIGVTASGSNNGTISCNRSNDTLSATVSALPASTTGTTTFKWSGPNGYSSVLQNPVVTTAGTYTVTATNGSLTGSASTIVVINQTPPTAVANGGTITCTNSSVSLSGSSNTTGVTYSWTSAPAGFTSTSQNPSVSPTAATVYTLTVTNPANGCQASDTANVFYNKTAPVVVATANGVLTCKDTVVTLTGTSTGSRLRYSWTGPSSFTSPLASPVVKTAGTYTLTTTDSTNGCTGSDTALVNQNKTLPVVTASATGQITCSNTSVTLTGVSSISGSTYSWSGPGSFTSPVQNPSVVTAGIYTLTATVTATGCSASDTAAVVLNNTGLVTTASANSLLTCKDTVATLTGTSTGTRVSYSWTGPGGFVSPLANPTVKTAGIYTLVTRDSVTGCTGTDTAGQLQNTTLPIVTASATGQLTCSNSSVTLTGVSSISGSTYSWSGPASFASAVQNPSVGTAGIYTLTARVTATGCSASDTALVTLNNTGLAVTTSASGVLTCKDTLATLTASSTGSRVSYSWSGPGGFASILQNPAVKVAGTYQLTTTDSATGCTGNSSIAVTQNITPPTVTASAPVPLACNNLVTTLTGSYTPSSGVTLSWTGPNTFSSALQNPTVSLPGIYTLTVTNTANGCVASDTASLTLNSTPPGASAAPAITLNCRDTVATLSGSSPTAGVRYAWTGPNGFSSPVQNPTVTSGGNYVLTVTDPSSGCTSIAGVAVGQDTVHPTNVAAAIISANTVLNCIYNYVILQGTSSSGSFTSAWSGPNGYNVAASATLAFHPGLYTYTATNPANFCSASASVTVIQDIAPPANLTAVPVVSQVTCAHPTTTVIASSSTPGVSYAWSGPNGFTSPDSTITVAAPGNYIILLTNPVNGCTNNTTIQVSQNITPPANVLASTASGLNQITCAASSQVLNGTSSTAGIQFTWSGPNGFTASGASISASVAGSYNLVATNPVNGCSASSGITLSQNTTAPAGVATTSSPVSGVINCNFSSIALSGTAASDSVSYKWAGPNGYTATTQNATAATAGNYVLTVTNTTNGCSSTATAVVTSNTTAPSGLSAFASQQITCNVSSVGITGASSTSGVSFNWSGPGGFTANTAHAQTGTPGLYTLTVTDPTNGCSNSTQLNVIANKTPPANVTATNSGPLTCDITQVTLTGTSTSPNVEYEWDGPNGYLSFSAQDVASDPGDYVLTVTNDDNGCVLLDTTTVVNNCGQRKAIIADTVAATGAAATGGFEWKVYPNPASNIAFVEFRLPETGLVTVQVYNGNGILERYCGMEWNGMEWNGMEWNGMEWNGMLIHYAASNQWYKLTLNESLPTGIHYFAIKANNKMYTKKIIVAR